MSDYILLDSAKTATIDLSKYAYVQVRLYYLNEFYCELFFNDTSFESNDKYYTCYSVDINNNVAGYFTYEHILDGEQFRSDIENPPKNIPKLSTTTKIGFVGIVNDNYPCWNFNVILPPEPEPDPDLEDLTKHVILDAEAVLNKDNSCIEIKWELGLDTLGPSLIANSYNILVGRHPIDNSSNTELVDSLSGNCQNEHTVYFYDYEPGYTYGFEIHIDYMFANDYSYIEYEAGNTVYLAIEKTRPQLIVKTSEGFVKRNFLVKTKDGWFEPSKAIIKISQGWKKL